MRGPWESSSQSPRSSPPPRRGSRRSSAGATAPPALARAGLTGSVYTLLPFVTFFNVARLELDADIGIGIVLGYVAVGDGRRRSPGGPGGRWTCPARPAAR